MRASYCSYWGKALTNDGDGAAYHLLPYHCLDVAAVGSVLLTMDTSLSRSLVYILGPRAHQVSFSWLLFFLALHDLGKFAEGFRTCGRISSYFSVGGTARKGTQSATIPLDTRYGGTSFGIAPGNKGGWGWRVGTREKRRWESLFDPIARSVPGITGFLRAGRALTT